MGSCNNIHYLDPTALSGPTSVEGPLLNIGRRVLHPHDRMRRTALVARTR